MKKVAVYCRLSTKCQDLEAGEFNNQLSTCLDYCRQKGYQVIRICTEQCSGQIFQRPAINDLRELVTNRSIDAVVVYSLDRLTRDPARALAVIDDFAKQKVFFEYVNGEQKTCCL